MRYLILFLPLFSFAQERSKIIYRATSNDTLVVTVFNSANTPLPVYLEATDSLYLDGQIKEQSNISYVVRLNNGDIIKYAVEDAKIAYTITKNGINAIQPITTDSSVIQFAPFFQAQDGFNFRTSSLTLSQATKWIGFLLQEKYRAIAPNGAFKFKRLRKYFTH